MYAKIAKILSVLIVFLFCCYFFCKTFETLLSFYLCFYLYYLECKTENTHIITHKHSYKHTTQVTFTLTYKYNIFFNNKTFWLTKVFTTTSNIVKIHKINTYITMFSTSTYYYDCLDIFVLITFLIYLKLVKIAFLVNLTKTKHATMLYTVVNLVFKIR